MNYSSQIQDEPRVAPESFSVAPHGSNWTLFCAVWRHGNNNLANSIAKIKQKYISEFDLDIGKVLAEFNKQMWRKVQVWFKFCPTMRLDSRSPAPEFIFQLFTSYKSEPRLPRYLDLIKRKTYLAIFPQLNQFKPSIATSSASVALPGLSWVDCFDSNPSAHPSFALTSTLQHMEPSSAQ